MRGGKDMAETSRRVANFGGQSQNRRETPRVAGKPGEARFRKNRDERVGTERRKAAPAWLHDWTAEDEKKHGRRSEQDRRQTQRREGPAERRGTSQRPHRHDDLPPNTPKIVGQGRVIQSQGQKFDEERTIIMPPARRTAAAPDQGQTYDDEATIVMPSAKRSSDVAAQVIPAVPGPKKQTERPPHAAKLAPLPDGGVWSEPKQEDFWKKTSGFLGRIKEIMRGDSPVHVRNNSKGD